MHFLTFSSALDFSSLLQASKGLCNNRCAPLQLTCTVKATNKKRSIPVIVRVSDINDNAPHFYNTPYETTVSEVRWPVMDPNMLYYNLPTFTSAIFFHFSLLSLNFVLLKGLNCFRDELLRNIPIYTSTFVPESRKFILQ
jgi:hypothetical protein